jgi:dipeptide/tripeptide permease
LFGIILIAIGSGGIRPCLSTFGGDQFILAESDQMRQVIAEMFLIIKNFNWIALIIVVVIHQVNKLN